MPGKIAPSMMCAPLFDLEKTIRAFEEEKIEYLHIDVMDGSFVPNLMLGTEYVKQLRDLTSIPLDIHLMVDRPEDKINWFDVRQGEYVSFHYEATSHVLRVCEKIREKGGKPMIALNPATPIGVLEDIMPSVDAILVMTVNPGYAGQKLIPQTMDKIVRLKDMVYEGGFNKMEIEADGNISPENAKKMRSVGVSVFVAGSSGLFFPGKDIRESVRAFRDCVK